MNKNIFYIVGTLLASLVVAPNANACGQLTITEMNWASSQVVTAVSKFILENGYGCNVTVMPSATVPAVTSLAETGKPDIATELWYNSLAIYHGLEKEGKVITAGDVLSDGGVEGWWIPEYLAKEHPELTTIEGIVNNPELVGGRFHNCPVGWQCRIFNDNAQIAYGLEKSGLEIFNHGSGETLATSIASAYNDKKPWFGYYWSPTSVLGKYRMVKVDVGPHIPEYYICNANVDCATPRKTDYPNAAVVTGVTKNFAQREPEAFLLMSKVSFTNQVMNTLLAWRENNNASSEEAAVYFLTNYKDVWNKWLSVNARDKLASIL